MTAAAKLDPRFGTPRYLSVRQPYAQAIIDGIKNVENRAWTTAYRGLLVIHAGKSRDELDERDSRLPWDYYREPSRLAFGAFIGATLLVDCVDTFRWDKDWPLKRTHPDYALVDWLSNNPFGDGPVCFILFGAVEFAHPVPFVGNTGLRSFDPGVLHPDDIAVVNATLLGTFLRGMDTWLDKIDN